MTIGAPRWTVAWPAEAGPAADEIVGLGVHVILVYEESIKEDSVITLTWGACPIDIADRVEIQPGQRILVSYGRGVNMVEPIAFTVEEPNTVYGAGITHTITARDRGGDMKGTQRRRVWTGDKISDIAEEIATRWGLRTNIETTPDVVNDKGEFPSWTQNNESDWRFLWRLSKLVGFRFWIEDSTLNLVIEPAGAPVVRYVYGSGHLVESFQVQTKRQEVAGSQDSVEIDSFDPATRTNIIGVANRDTDDRQKLSGAVIDVDGNIKLISGGAVGDRAVVAADQANADAMAKGLRAENTRPQQTAKFSTEGRTFYRAGIFVEMAEANVNPDPSVGPVQPASNGVARVHGGLWRVPKAKQTLGGGGWTCDMEFDRETVGANDDPNQSKVDPSKVRKDEAVDDGATIDAETGRVLL